MDLDYGHTPLVQISMHQPYIPYFRSAIPGMVQETYPLRMGFDITQPSTAQTAVEIGIKEPAVQYVVQDVVQDEVRDVVQDEVQDKVQDEIQDVIQDEVQAEISTEVQDEVQDEVKADVQDEVEDEVQDKKTDVEEEITSVSDQPAEDNQVQEEQPIPDKVDDANGIETAEEPKEVATA